LGYLPILHFLQIAEDYCLTQIRRQLLKRYLEDFAGLAAGDRLVGPGGSGGSLFFEHGELLLDGIGDAFLTGSAIVVDQKVTGDTGQPRIERTFGAAERLHRTEHPEKDFLRKILGFLTAIREPVTDTVDLPRVQAHEFLPCGFIAAQAPGDQGLFQAVFRQMSPSGYDARGVGKIATGSLCTKPFQS
jgi:hypothetical protein